MSKAAKSSRDSVLEVSNNAAVKRSLTVLTFTRLFRLNEKVDHPFRVSYGTPASDKLAKRSHLLMPSLALSTFDMPTRLWACKT